MATTSILPVETIEVEILPRLPVKSLLRFKSVCKSWNSLISSDAFIKSFHNSDRDSRSVTFISRRPYKYGYNHDNYYEQGLRTRCMGCINGLVFIEYSQYSPDDFGICGFTVWNPATKQCLETEPSPSQVEYDDSFPGFGFDSVANDYKLMHVVIEDRLVGYIYSCNAGSWSKITHSSFVLPGYISNLLNPVIVDGSPFWLITQCYDPNKSGLLVMSFDVRQEFFRLLPDLGSSGSITKDKLGESYELLNFRDSPAVMFYNTKFWYGETFDIHIFNEKRDDWSKMSFVPFKFLNKVPTSPMELRFLKCLRNGDILFSRYRFGVTKLYWVNLENYTIKSLGKRVGLCRNDYTYSESLVFIDGMKPSYEREGQFRFLVLERPRRCKGKKMEQEKSSLLGKEYN